MKRLMRAGYHAILRAMKNLQIAIIGAGFGGLGAAIRLKQRGHNFTIFERAEDVGGTWRDNVYPGAACDVPSHAYSLSFEQNPNWSRKYSSSGRNPQVPARFGDEVEVARAVALRRTHCGGALRRRARALDAARRHRCHARSGCGGGQRRWAGGPGAAEHRRRARVRGRSFSHRALGPRLHACWQARRRHRHRRECGAGGAEHCGGGRAAQRVSAHAGLGGSETRPRVSHAPASRLRALSVAAARESFVQILDERSARADDFPERAAPFRARRADEPAAFGGAGERPVAARKACARIFNSAASAC